MKKIVGACIVLLLAGCSSGGGNNDSSSSVDSNSTTQSSITESMSSIEQMSSSMESVTESISVETSGNSGVEANESAGISLYVPGTLKQDEGTDLFNEVIDVANQFTAETAPLSEEGLYTLSYTGYYIENEDGKVQAYFIGVNRIGEALSNLNFTLNLLVGDTAVWDNMSFKLNESEFGQQPNNSAMPIFLDIPAGKEQTLMDAKPEDIFIEIKDLSLE